MTIQWFPGHMAKTRKLIQENLKGIDVVVEILDGRIPLSSKNPLIDDLIKGKERLVILNKSDLADEVKTKEWIEYFDSQEGTKAIQINSLKDAKNIKKLIKDNIEILTKEKREKKLKKGIKSFAIRIMIVGIPNVGKSTFINSIVGKQSAKVGNKPGVTRGKQWIKFDNEIEIMDTPGILWPKFEDPDAGLKLALTGAIKDDVFHFEPSAIALIDFLKKNYPNKLKERYKLTDEELDLEAPLLTEKIGEKRGCLLKGGIIDMKKTASIIITEYRKGSLGKITLESPENIDKDEEIEL